MKKFELVQLPEVGQLGSVIDRILLFKQDQALSNICVQYKSKATTKLTNKSEYAQLVEYIFEFTDKTFEILMVELTPVMDAAEIRLMRLLRKWPSYKMQNIQKINAAYDAKALIYYNDYEDRHDKRAFVKVVPNHPDYAEARQHSFYLGTTYFDFVRNKQGQIVDGFLRLKTGINASDAIEWLVNDRDTIKFFDCSSSVTLIEYLSVLDFLKELNGAEQGIRTFNRLFGSEHEIVPDNLRLLFSPLGTTVGVKTSLPRQSTPAFNLTNESKTSDNPDDFPINPIAYFIRFKFSRHPDILLQGQVGKQPVCVGENAVIINHPGYVYKHPAGIFAGLNCICVGKNAKGEDIFSGFGVRNKTEQEIKLLLLESYNAKSSIQTELENSTKKAHRKLGKSRHIMLAAQFNVPDKITIHGVEGFAASGTTELSPNALYQLSMNIDELRQRIESFTKTGMHQIMIPSPQDNVSLHSSLCDLGC